MQTGGPKPWHRWFAWDETGSDAISGAQGTNLEFGDILFNNGDISWDNSGTIMISNSLNEEKKRLSVKFPLRTEVRFYNFELKNDKITYFMPFLRSQDNFPEIWKFDIDLIQLKRSFTARKIPDNQMKTLVKLLNEAKVNTNAFLAQEKLEKDKFSNEIFNLKKDLFKKNYTNPDEWNDTKIPYGNSGDYILKKGEITYQSKFTFPCKIKN